jgi:hypothetical protein
LPMRTSGNTGHSKVADDDLTLREEIQVQTLTDRDAQRSVFPFLTGRIASSMPDSLVSSRSYGMPASAS